MPPINPPPPTATSSVSMSGRSASISQPTVPWPSRVSRLVEGVHGKRAAVPGELLAGRQRVGIALAGDHQIGRVALDAFDLRRRSHAGQEDRCRHAEPHRGIGHRRAMIAAGCRDHAARRNRPCQQVRERAARLERPRMLQAFKLQRHRSRLAAEIREVDMNNRRMADVRPDQPLGFGDALRRDRVVQRHCGPRGRLTYT